MSKLGPFVVLMAEGPLVIECDDDELCGGWSAVAEADDAGCVPLDNLVKLAGHHTWADHKALE